MKCDICGEPANPNVLGQGMMHLNVCAFGSEGITVCERCARNISDYVRTMRQVVTRACSIVRVNCMKGA